MVGENLIHIKLEYKEALQSKKDLLSSQMALLKAEKTIRGYRSYRAQGFQLRENLSKKIKGLRSSMWNLQKSLPKLKIPGILKKEVREEELHEYPEGGETYDGDLEKQLHDIQRRLKELQSKGAESNNF
jgi:hypothetical protein